MTTTPLRALAAAAAALAALALTGCSGAGDGDASSDGGGSAAEPAPAADAPAGARDGAGSDADQSAAVADSELARHGATRNRAPVQVQQQQALIKHGSVELTGKDVGHARFEVQQVVDRYGGQVSEEETTTDDDGDPAYTRMVLRVPADRFDEAVTDISAVAELVSARTSEDDVTTKLIDTRTRVAVQKRSIARISTLLDRAQSIRDIMAIESQLSRRQAALESLERRLAYLTGQTTLSTITVSIDRTPPPAVKKSQDDDSGFVAGLKAGWGGLTTFAVAIATVTGALLPWLVVVALLGPPAFLLVRAIRRRVSARNPGRTPSAA